MSLHILATQCEEGAYAAATREEKSTMSWKKHLFAKAEGDICFENFGKSRGLFV